MVPGLGDSGPLHWQSLWERSQPFEKTMIQRVRHSSWDRPVFKDWMKDLKDDLKKSQLPTYLICHSLGCLLAAELRDCGNVRAMLLVAPADVYRSNRTSVLEGFSRPMRKTMSPNILVVSRNDPYASFAWSSQLQHVLESSQFVDVGFAGHINADSDLGEWEFGKELVRRMIYSY